MTFIMHGLWCIVPSFVLQAHVNVCHFTIIKCVHANCTTEVKRSLLAEHLKDECLYRSVRCENCHETLPFASIEVCPLIKFWDSQRKSPQDPTTSFLQFKVSLFTKIQPNFVVRQTSHECKLTNWPHLNCVIFVHPLPLTLFTHPLPLTSPVFTTLMQRISTLYTHLLRVRSTLPTVNVAHLLLSLPITLVILSIPFLVTSLIHSCQIHPSSQ